MNGCKNWNAWLSLKPPGRPTLFVEGQCDVPGSDYHVELQRREPVQTAPSGPVIRGPVAWARDDASPEFEVRLGANQFFAVEVASSAELFGPAGKAQRTDVTFYSSWQSGSLLSAASYVLPDAVWRRLVRARSETTRLYYRMWTSASANDWVNAQASVPNDSLGNAPWIQVVDHQVPLVLAFDPHVRILERVVRAPATSSSPGAASVSVRYVERAAGDVKTVLILPDGVLLPLDTAP